MVDLLRLQRHEFPIQVDLRSPMQVKNLVRSVNPPLILLNAGLGAVRLVEDPLGAELTDLGVIHPQLEHYSHFRLFGARFGGVSG